MQLMADAPKTLSVAVAVVRLAGMGALFAGLSSWLLTATGLFPVPVALTVGGVLLLFVAPGLLVALDEIV